MAPSATLPSAGQARETSGGFRGSLPAPFLTKTYRLVDDPALDDVISWNNDGTSFIVWRPAEFAHDLLPKLFKHNNFSSFVRQLNTYGFRKIVPDRWEFANDCFRRGERRLLCHINRRKMQASGIVRVPGAIAMETQASGPADRSASPTHSGEGLVLSSNLSQGGTLSSSGSGCSGASSDLEEDNHRLRRENERLRQELSKIKDLCNSIHLLVSDYANQQRRPGEETYSGSGGHNDQDKGEETVQSSRLDPLMAPTWCHSVTKPERPSEKKLVQATGREPEKGPRLFGVSIGVKRSWGGERETNELSQQRRVVIDV